MDIAHVAIWTADPERLADFYCGFFAAQSGAPHHGWPAPRCERQVSSSAPTPIAALWTVFAWWAIVGSIVLPACSRRQTDQEKIRALFADAARAAEEKRIDDVLRGVSDGFEGQGLDKRGVRQLVAFHLLRGSWVAVTISGDRIAVDGDGADAVVDVVMLRSGKGRALTELLPEQAAVHRFTMKLKREPDGWKVTSAAWRPISLEDAAAGPGAPTR